MATFFGDVQYSQNGTVTNPWKLTARMRIAFHRFSEENDLYRGQVHEAALATPGDLFFWDKNVVTLR